jgi:predicted MFS family arabinose efflux permease
MSTADKSELRIGWRVVLGAFIGIGSGFASLYFYTAGIFIKPLAAEFGWTRGEASLGSMSTLIGVLAFPLAGRLIDRFGEVRVAFASGVALSLSFAMLGWFIQGLVSYVLLIVLLTAAAAGSISIAYNRVIVRHFVAQRGMALGLALTGTAIGSAIVGPLLTPYIGTHGWRQGYFALSLLSLAMLFVAIFLLRPYSDRTRRSSEEKASSTGWLEISRHPAFLPISVMIFLASTAVLGSTMHIVPLLTDQGLSLPEAAGVASMLGFSVIFGRILTGFLLDRWDAGIVTWTLFSLASLGTLALWTGHPMLTVAGAMLIGFGVGTEGDLLAFLLGRRFHPRDFGSVYGLIFGVHALGGGLGGVIAGASFDWTGDYRIWLLASTLGLLAAGIIAFITERNIRPYNERTDKSGPAA